MREEEIFFLDRKCSFLFAVLLGNCFKNELIFFSIEIRQNGILKLGIGKNRHMQFKASCKLILAILWKVVSQEDQLHSKGKWTS